MQRISGSDAKNTIKGSGLTIQKVCKEANISEAAISQWCNGKRDIMLDSTYNKLVDAYNKLKESK